MLKIAVLALAAALSLAGSAALAVPVDEGRNHDERAAKRGRLTVRLQPGGGVDAAAPHGLQPLGLGGARDGLIYVPPTYRPGRPAPLLVMLHGAGGNGRDALRPLTALADAAGLILLAPDSRGPTWDVILGGYGPDVAFIDRALARTFARYAVDPAHVAAGGFSDGASYALSLGLTNGDLFSHVVAFSPGFMAPAGERDAPRVFISHGTGDTVLPIDVCSRQIVPALERAGYDIRYQEFAGGHAVPPAIAREAVDWFLR